MWKANKAAFTKTSSSFNRSNSISASDSGRTRLKWRTKELFEFIDLDIQDVYDSNKKETYNLNYFIEDEIREEGIKKSLVLNFLLENCFCPLNNSMNLFVSNL